MGFLPAVIGGIGGLAGAIGGVKGSQTSSSQTSGFNLQPAGQLEQYGGQIQGGGLNQLLGLYGAQQQTQNFDLAQTANEIRQKLKTDKNYSSWQGQSDDQILDLYGKEYGYNYNNTTKQVSKQGIGFDPNQQAQFQQDIAGARGAQTGLAQMLEGYSKTGGLPSEQDITGANQVAQNLYNPQRVALQQSFTEQNTEAQRLAARLGRDVNDPILQAKLRTGFMNQQAGLEAGQGAFAQQFALQQPERRLGYAGQRADILGGLATQAFQNRAAIMGLGSNLFNTERQFRANTAERYGTNQQQSGGGLGGAITGAIGGAGSGFQVGQGIQNMFQPSFQPFGPRNQFTGGTGGTGFSRIGVGGMGGGSTPY